MSWSVSLSGKKQQVHAELRHAILEMQHALDAVERADNPNVSVSVGGSCSSGVAEGSLMHGANFTVQEWPDPKPVIVEPVNIAEARGADAPEPDPPSAA